MYQFDVFNNENLGSVRTACSMGDATIWFVAKDVCDCLGIKNSRDAMSKLLSDEKMTVGLTDSHSGKRGGAQKIAVVSESGLYNLIMRSRKKEAEEFQRWVTRTVLPSIRKNGAYVMGQEDMEPKKREELLDLIAHASKRAKYFEDDSNHWYEQFERVSREFDEVSEELVKAKKALRKENGGIDPVNPKHKDGFILREDGKTEGIWTDAQLLVENIPEGLKYSILDREER